MPKQDVGNAVSNEEYEACTPLRKSKGSSEDRNVAPPGGGEKITKTPERNVDDWFLWRGRTDREERKKYDDKNKTSNRSYGWTKTHPTVSLLGLHRLDA